MKFFSWAINDASDVSKLTPEKGRICQFLWRGVLRRLKSRYINNELEEGRPVISKSVYPRNSVWIANLDTEHKHCTKIPGDPGRPAWVSRNL